MRSILFPEDGWAIKQHFSNGYKPKMEDPWRKTPYTFLFLHRMAIYMRYGINSFNE